MNLSMLRPTNPGRHQSQAFTAGRNVNLVFTLAFALGLTRMASAQGTLLQVLSTGGGTPLVSRQATAVIPAIDAPVLEFDFGFATEEVAAPGELLDSFTVSLKGDEGNSFTFLVTSDSSGVAWLPPTPGGTA